MSNLWGAFALPSLTTLLVVIDTIARRRVLRPHERRLLLIAMAFVSVVFYPLAVGLGPVDVYRFGFTAWAPFALAIIGCALAFRHFRLACAVLFIIAAFDVHLLPTLNLFDYLIDPIGGLFAIGWCVATAITVAWRHRSRHA